MTLTALLLAVALAAAGTTPTIAPGELRPGMTGYGLSVFGAAGSIDTFQVEVIDVMRNVSPGRDMIVCRCTGQGLEHSGIIAGMSGSPVYFDGRLAGAVAYGWGFSKDPVGGITPIGEMLELLELPDSVPSGLGPGGGFEHRSLRHLPVPLGIPGCPARLAALAAPMLADYGLVPVAAGSGAGAVEVTAIAPGGAVGVLLADGDIRYSAIGTITWTEGDRLLAFGHPMFQGGTSALPMCGGRIHTIIASVAESFKLFTAGPAIGTVVQDRLPAISGIIGPVPTMIPVRASISSPTGRRDYRFDIARLDPLVPIIAALGLADLAYATEGVFEEMTLEAMVRVRVEDSLEFKFRHVFSGRSTADELARALADKLRLLVDNHFRTVRLDSLGVTLEFRPGLRRQTITGVRVPRSTVAPGDTVALRLDLRDDYGHASTRRFDVLVPARAPAGRLTLWVQSADSLLLREAYRTPGLVNPRSLGELGRLLERDGNEDVLVITGYTALPGLALGGRELPALPPTLRAILGSGLESGRLMPSSESRLFEQRVKFDEVIAGVHEIVLEVKR